MCYYRFLYFLLMLLLLLPTSVFTGRANENKVKHFGNNDGLSNSSINSIFQDSNGLMWFGTWDGLNVYNGAEFETFRHERYTDSVCTISHPVVRDIFEERKGVLWITTDFGINRFDLATHQIESYYLGYRDSGIFREKSFLATTDGNGHVLASVYNTGVFLFNAASKSFDPVELPQVDARSVTHLFFDASGHLWLVCDRPQEIWRLTLTFDKSGVGVTNSERLTPEHPFVYVCYDRQNRVWLQDDAHNLYSCHIAEKRFLPWYDWNGKKLSSRLNAVLSTSEKIYFATTSGLIVCDKADWSVSHLFSGISIFSVCQGSQDILWVGTDTQGVYRLLDDGAYFTSYTRNNIPELGTYAIRSIYRDGNNVLWVGTKGGGLVSVTYLGSTLQNSRKYTRADGLLNNSVFAIAPGRNGDFWIGTDGRGVNYYDAGRQAIRTLASSEFDLSQIESIYGILQSNDSTLWLATGGNGLFRLHFDRRYAGEYRVTSLVNYRFTGEPGGIKGNVIYDMVMQGDSTLWVTTRGGGLNRLDLRTGSFTGYDSGVSASEICSNDVICLYVDRKDRLWVGTSAGLNCLEDVNAPVFKHYTESNGLANSNIHAILEDAEGYIWVSTNKGLSRMDVRHETFVHYFYSDGLQDNEFSDGAALSVSDGQELYFGGVNGFNVFRPSQIGLSDYNPPLYLSSFRIDNEMQELPRNAVFEPEIDYRSHSIGFHFSILDYVANDKCKLAYKLLRENDDDTGEWISIGNGRDVILSNLASGHYTLHVSYTNRDNQWTEDAFLFQFTVASPWWATRTAFVIYLLLVLGISFLFVWIQRYRMAALHNREMERLEVEKKEEIHQAKLRFFTNIAHEFSNSITLIYGPCERLINDAKLDGKSRELLNIIKRNAERMQQQIQQLMEFRKAETGHLTLHFESVDVQELIKYTSDSFLEVAEEKKIRLSLDLDKSVPAWVLDRDAFEKVIFNLLSNAFKYTPANGTVNVVLGLAEDGQLMFRCTNSGPGIAPEMLQTVFNRFRVLDNFESKLSQGVYTRNGIGLAMCQNLVRLLNGTISVDSKVDEYTSFTVLISADNVAEAPVQPAIGEIIAALPELPKEYVSEKDMKTILVIDDQPEIRQFIIGALGERYVFVEAGDGQQALEEMKRVMPDLILCDVVMPVMDGFTFLQKVKEDVRTKHIPVILLSSKSSVENQIEGIEHGADMYIGKPFHPGHLSAVVNRILGNQEAIRNYMESPLVYAEQFNGKLIDKMDKELMDKILSLLSQNLDNEEYNQDALSADLSISRVQLYRKIKTLTDRTPADFIRNYRLQEAERMLRTTNKTVQEIMVDCGFHNKAYFYRVFAKVYHCPPKEYRMQQTGMQQIGGENEPGSWFR